MEINNNISTEEEITNVAKSFTNGQFETRDYYFENPEKIFELLAKWIEDGALDCPEKLIEVLSNFFFGQILNGIDTSEMRWLNNIFSRFSIEILEKLHQIAQENRSKEVERDSQRPERRFLDNKAQIAVKLEEILEDCLSIKQGNPTERVQRLWRRRKEEEEYYEQCIAGTSKDWYF
ncbi:hypothetical protein KKC94_00590 [Patescibacteria group bacterium]|nr:hypothetical protein [Patescibacteria group bacterium]